MGIYRKSESLWLFLGDAAVFLLSLFVTLVVRYGEFPSRELFLDHLEPFSLIFIISVFFFFIAGLYEKHTLILKSKLPNKIISAQASNVAVAVLFFYLIPYFGITPKTNLFIYLVISSMLLIGWRFYGPRLLSHEKSERGLLIGSGQEAKELMVEVNENPRYNLSFVSYLDLSNMSTDSLRERIHFSVKNEGVGVIVIDSRNEKIEPVLPDLYDLTFSSIRFIDMHRVYEDIFDRVPLSLVRDNWFLENMSSTAKSAYDALKRAMDVIIALPLALLSLILYPFVYCAIKMEDGGSVFYHADRVGENNKSIRIVKFRTMTGKDLGGEVLKSRQVETRVGRFLRKTRIDELPQLWDVVQGDLSLIGPRPEFRALVEHYEKEVPYYNIRHLIKPGLSGWGQINDSDVPRKGADVVRTKRKLSYDLYYIKNRSLVLDIKIALKTVGTIISRTGS